MSSLYPHQVEILSRLRDPHCPSRGWVEGPIGTGLRRPIAIRAGEVAAESVVLVLCQTRAMAERWVTMLQEESPAVLVMDSAEVALRFLEERQRIPSGVVVSTYARLLHGPSSRMLMGLEFGLIVLDEPSPELPDEVRILLQDRAGRLVGVTNLPHLRSRREGWPVSFRVSNEFLLKDGIVNVVDVLYEPTAVELEVRTEAIEVLREHAGRHGHQLTLQSDSAPALHAQLLAVASDTDDESLSERAWKLLDRMESSGSSDTRLDAMWTIAEQVIGNGGRCVIMVHSPSDARYVAEHLARTRKVEPAVVDAATPLAAMRSVLNGLAAGEVFVATTVICESADLWPHATAIVLWPSPSDRPRIPNSLALLIDTRPDITVHVLRDGATQDFAGR